jgi:hypothetical protein
MFVSQKNKIQNQFRCEPFEKMQHLVSKVIINKLSPEVTCLF